MGTKCCIVCWLHQAKCYATWILPNMLLGVCTICQERRTTMSLNNCVNLCNQESLMWKVLPLLFFMKISEESEVINNMAASWCRARKFYTEFGVKAYRNKSQRHWPLLQRDRYSTQPVRLSYVQQSLLRTYFILLCVFAML